MMLLPTALCPGDPVAVIAPSSPFDRDRFERGLARLAQRYLPVLTDELYTADRYLAGSDPRRLEELNHALAGDARAIFCARGGYGAARLLPKLDLDHPSKPLIGFSDITALHALFLNAGARPIHGPVVTQLGTLAWDQAEHLFTLLEDPSFRPTLSGLPMVDGPTVEGPVVGGNLSVFSRLIGTPYLPNLDGAILFLEDVGERPYKLDRMWQHLVQGGCLDRLVGIVLGEWTDCDDRENGVSAETVLAELARERGLPCLSGLPCGHGDTNLAFPLGARARLDTSRCLLQFLEGAVS